MNPTEVHATPFSLRVKGLYPNFEVTGASNNHCSTAAFMLIEKQSTARGIVSEALKAHHYIGLRLTLGNIFPGIEWLVSDKEIYQMVVSDVYHQATTGSEVNSGVLVNPKTGNRYYKVALDQKNNLVFGVRGFFLKHPAGTAFSYRFRVQQQIETSDRVREASREEVIRLKETVIEIQDYIETKDVEPIKVQEQF